jgi:transposase-like protein
MTGTIFHGSKIALRIWLFVLFEMCANKNGMAAREIERKYGLSPKSSWFMAHRIREAMKAKAPGSMVGIIVVDETYIGGDPGLMNKKARAKWEAKRMTPHSGFRGNSSDKAPVLSLINANTGEVRSAVVPKVDGTNLRKVIAAQVNMAGSTLWTDEGSWYGQIGEEFLAHETVNHSDEEYVGRHGQSTNKLESYFSQLKRSLDGTHHRVSEEHLPRYLTHFDFLYTTRDLPESLRMAQLVDQAEGRRLSYKRVKG